ncbi:nuclear receptor subfamily 1 group D member 1-like isoform X1 [Stegodyphus dumicola]|uniref:nuclear receptor subfamily 1 group D member 1-like isoform X1 n=2 Tax=Stegodyphus dumicola TaxID=202533 RepID=UPI0015B08AA5|nr:nuclear receptor subfamily 1 group D member 1-like isoform X1 [Stegodyphus dumicola]
MLNLLCFGFVVGNSWHYTGHALPAMSLPPNGSQQSPHHHLPPSESPSSSQQHYPSPSRRQKVCGACGDRAKSYHFGGISCDSCKAFFRRSVQNEAYKNFHCPYEGKCEITITSRKCCQYCRFKKCLSIGMETGWVMTEEERLQLVKNRMERKQRQGASESVHQATESGKKPHRTTSFTEYEPDINDLPKYLAPEDMRTIETLVNAYEASYTEVPFSEHLHKVGSASGRTRTEILDMFFTAVKQFTNFSQRLDTFSKIQQHDQEILLRTGVLELCFIRGAYVYDEKLSRWPHIGKPMYRDSPTLDAEDIKKLVSPELFTKHMEFIRSIKELHPDEATTMLLLVIVLLSPDRPGLENEVLVAEEQEKFYILMKKYMLWRYGEENTLILYPKLLLRLPDLRELNDNHTDYNLRLGSEEIQQIQQKLSSLKIDSCFQRSDVSSSSSPAPRGSSTPGHSGTSGFEMGSRTPWSLRRDVLRTPSSPYSQEEESSSSESSDRMLPYRS